MIFLTQIVAEPITEKTAEVVDPAAVAASLDPAAVAAHMVPPAPLHPAVEIASRFFGSVDSAIVAAMFALGIFLLARLIQSLLLHRSINKSIDAQSSHAAALIEKVNKPFEAGGPGEMPGDDRNGLVLVAIGIAMAGFGFIQGDETTIRIACGAALFPLLVGIALLIGRRLVLKEIERELATGRG